MTFLSSQILVPAVFVVLLCIATHIVNRLVKSTGLPPGPPGSFFLGTTIPLKNPHLKLEEWTRKYGPVYSFRRGIDTVVVIGRYQPAVEIMEKHGAYLADRPLSIAAGETISGGMRVLLVGVGTRLAKLRKALHSRLQEKVAVEYEPLQLRNAKNVVLDILKDPLNHQNHSKRYAASVIMTLTYGKTTLTSYSDPEVQKITLSASRLGAAVRPGAYLVDSFPLLRYVPGYLTQLRAFHRDELELFRSQLDAVREKMDAGKDVLPCFAKHLIENQKKYGLSNNEAAYLAGSMFGAGSDTSASAISIVIMAAATHPDLQSEVQAELDRVIGSDRYPTFADQESLPLTVAFFLETFRWRPVSITGFAHRATKDIIWRNYLIPAGSTVIGSHWSVSKDPEVFPDPDTFNPYRWIAENGRIRDDLKSFNFGFGRRVCVGQSVANRSVFINTALLLWAFHMSEDPSSLIDTMAFTDTANIRPLPFNVNFQPRLDPNEIRRL